MLVSSGQAWARERRDIALRRPSQFLDLRLDQGAVDGEWEFLVLKFDDIVAPVHGRSLHGNGAHPAGVIT